MEEMLHWTFFWSVTLVVLGCTTRISADITEVPILTVQAEANGRIDPDVLEIYSTDGEANGTMTKPLNYLGKIEENGEGILMKDGFSSLLIEQTTRPTLIVNSKNLTHGNTKADTLTEGTAVKEPVFLDMDAASSRVKTKLVKITEQNLTIQDENGTKDHSPLTSRNVVTEISVLETKDGHTVTRKPTEDELRLLREKIPDEAEDSYKNNNIPLRDSEDNNQSEVEDLSSFLDTDSEDDPDMFDSWQDEDEEDGDEHDPHDMESIMKEEDPVINHDHDQVTTEPNEKDKEDSSGKDPGDYRKIYHTERKNFSNVKEFKIMISETEGDFFDDDDFPAAATEGVQLNKTSTANNTEGDSNTPTTQANYTNEINTTKSQQDDHLDVIADMIGKMKIGADETTESANTTMKTDMDHFVEGSKRDDTKIEESVNINKTASADDNHLAIIKDLLEELNANSKPRGNKTEGQTSSTQESVISNKTVSSTDDSHLAVFKDLLKELNEDSKLGVNKTEEVHTSTEVFVDHTTASSATESVDTISNNIIETTTLLEASLITEYYPQDDLADNGVSVTDLSEVVTMIHNEDQEKDTTQFPSIADNNFAPPIIEKSVTTPPWAKDILKEYELETGGDHDDFDHMESDFMTTPAYGYFNKFLKEIAEINRASTTRKSLFDAFTATPDMISLLPSEPLREITEISRAGTTRKSFFDAFTASPDVISLLPTEPSREITEINRAGTTRKSFFDAFTRSPDVISLLPTEPSREITDINRAGTTRKSFFDAFTRSPDVITTEPLRTHDFPVNVNVEPASTTTYIEFAAGVTTQVPVQSNDETPAEVVSVEEHTKQPIPVTSSPIETTTQDQITISTPTVEEEFHDFHGLSPSDVASMFNRNLDNEYDLHDDEYYDQKEVTPNTTEETEKAPMKSVDEPSINEVLPVSGHVGAVPILKTSILNNSVELNIKINNKNETFYVPDSAHVSQFGNIVNITWGLNGGLNNSIAFRVFSRGPFYMIKEIMTNLFIGGSFVMQHKPVSLYPDPVLDETTPGKSRVAMLKDGTYITFSTVEFLKKNAPELGKVEKRNDKMWHVEIASICLAIVVILAVMLYVFTLRTRTKRITLQEKDDIPQVTHC